MTERENRERFNEALVNAEARKQGKEKEKKAKRSYINDLIKSGVDPEIAKVMASVNFEYRLIKAL